MYLYHCQNEYIISYFLYLSILKISLFNSGTNNSYNNNIQSNLSVNCDLGDNPDFVDEYGDDCSAYASYGCDEDTAFEAGISLQELTSSCPVSCFDFILCDFTDIDNL